MTKRSLKFFSEFCELSQSNIFFVSKQCSAYFIIGILEIFLFGSYFPGIKNLASLVCLFLSHNGLFSESCKSLRKLFLGHLTAFFGVNSCEFFGYEAERDLQDSDEKEKLGERDHTVVV